VQHLVFGLSSDGAAVVAFLGIRNGYGVHLIEQDQRQGNSRVIIDQQESS
jgi:hypothetical protein